jgi:hypothetical protein
MDYVGGISKKLDQEIEQAKFDHPDVNDEELLFLLSEKLFEEAKKIEVDNKNRLSKS